MFIVQPCSELRLSIRDDPDKNVYVIILKVYPKIKKMFFLHSTVSQNGLFIVYSLS